MSSQSPIEKVTIIGSGPAGLTAAIYTSRAGLNPLMFEGEEVGGQLMTTTEVENYPGFPDGITGPELVEVVRKQAERFGTRFKASNVSGLDLSARPFSLWVGDQKFLSHSIIISTGASAKYLGLDSEKKFLNKGVSSCATCDGAFFKGMEVAIVGGGDTAMEEALFLTRFATQVHLLHRRDSFRASKYMINKVVEHPKIKIHWNTVVEEVKGTKFVESLVLKDAVSNQTRELSVGGLFVAIGHQPNTAIFKGHIELHENGYIKTQLGRTMTSVEGVFAAGDVADHIYRQAITAAGTGCMAAMDAERWLEGQGL